MALSERQRDWLARMERVAADTDDSGWGSPAARRWMIERANARRARRGVRPLEGDPDYPPELELHERARALGLLRRRRDDA